MSYISDLNDFTTPLGFSTTKASNLVILTEIIDGKIDPKNSSTRFYNMTDFFHSLDLLTMVMLEDIQNNTYDGEAWLSSAQLAQEVA